MAELPIVDTPLRLSPALAGTIASRKSIYLDTNVWIRLAEEKDELSAIVKELLLSLCAKELIFCPLSAPTIWELRKQKGDSLDATAALMDTLSLNVSLKYINDIFNSEVDIFFKNILYGTHDRLSCADIYAPLIGYIFSGYKLSFPESFPKGDIYKFSEHISGIMERMSLSHFLKMIGNKPPLERKPPSYYEENIERRRQAQGSKSRMRRIEQAKVAERFIIPRLNAKRSLLPIERQLGFVKKMQQFPRSKKYGSALEYLLPKFPALSAYAEISAVSGFDINRKDSMRDFFDREFMTYGLAYPHVFVSIDKWIIDLMRNHVNKSLPSRTVFLSSLTELVQYLGATSTGMWDASHNY